MAGHTLTAARQPMAVQHHRDTVHLSGGMAFDKGEFTGVKRAGGFIAQHGRWLTVDSVGAANWQDTTWPPLLVASPKQTG